MQLLARRVERQLRSNIRRHMFAEELESKFQRLRECFTGNPLPSPSEGMTVAWGDVPNKTVDILPMSMKTTFVQLQAPPPTPTGCKYDDTDDATSSESSLSDNCDHGWVLVDSTDKPITCQNPGCPAASNNDSLPQCSESDQRWEKQTVKEDASQSSGSSSPISSDQESQSSDGRTSSTPVGFYHMVDQWYLDYRVRGTEPFIESLIAFGVLSSGTATLASRIAYAIIKRVARISHTEAKSLENAFRCSVLVSFKKSWELNDTWLETSPSVYGVNIASFIGSLFDAKIISARDIHLCLSFLVEGEKNFDRLSAMHAMLVQANDKLCKTRSLPALLEFKNSVTCKDEKSGDYLWVTSPRSLMILTDILVTIERWTVSQAIRREQPRVLSDRIYPIRNRAIGPRLRNGSDNAAAEAAER